MIGNASSYKNNLRADTGNWHSPVAQQILSNHLIYTSMEKKTLNDDDDGQHAFGVDCNHQYTQETNGYKIINAKGNIISFTHTRA